MFDGLDEVADIVGRREVVDEITKGINRLREVAISLQSIVTSRPAAFTNSPGLSETTFRYFQLASINRPLIDQYANKWLKARSLEGKDASDVRQILKNKLDQPHLRQLARNPMQLAILLSLIHTRGVSLPDKRTALYDSYVELFFNREAENSSVVRDHRDLLIDIHRYLEWILHSESQTKSDTAQRLNLIFRSGQKAFVEADEERFKVLVDYALSGNTEIAFRRNPSILNAFIHVLSPQRYAVAFQARQPVPLSSVLERRNPFFVDNDGHSLVGEVPSFAIARKCNEIVNLSLKLSERNASDWATQLSPWQTLVESGRNLFGDRWAFCLLANTATGIRSKEETCEDAPVLHDQSVALCRRARYARLRAGTANWWESQLEPTTDQMDLAFTLLILVTWAGPTVFQKLAGLVDEKLRILDANWWMKLSWTVQSTAYGFGQGQRDIEVDLEMFPKTISERTIVAISSRISERAAEELFQKHLRSYDGEDTSILEFCQRMAIYSAQRNPETWKDWLPIILHSYTKGAVSDRYFGYRFANAIHSQRLPLEIAEEIVESCNIYPTELVGWAEQTCRGYVAENIVPVGIAAERQNWFKS